MRGAAGGDVFQTEKLADTVLYMHDQFAHRQRRYVGNKIFGGHLFSGAAVLALAENILLGNQTPAGTFETVRQIHYNQSGFLVSRFA